MKDIKKIISWLLVIIWMSIIFYLSHQTGEGSGSLSGSITEKMLGVLRFLKLDGIDIDFLHFLVRKGAHLLAYFVLGILVVNAFMMSGMLGRKYETLALVICVFYAMTDEAHQLLVPGRSGQVVDVLIDTIGALAGIFTYKMVLKLTRFAINNKG